MSAQAGDTGLPIESVIDDLRQALRSRRRAVLTAEPGAGKTTVVPLRLLSEPWLGNKRIVMLEPRRLAARSCAQRMASLLGESVGETVGVTTRDDRRVSPATRIEVVTEGILTRRLQHDPTLESEALVIFDEFHERSQQADLGLGLLLDAQRALDLDLAIMVMSATIDAPKVAGLIGGPDGPAPVIACEGRTHPVAVHWRPRNRRDRLEPAVADAVEWAAEAQPDGDLLVFLPGMAEIRRVQDLLRRLDPRFEVHALHGSLPLDEQDRAVAAASPGFRKVVLSTDIAESSLTVEGVTAVIDSGLARSPRFDPASGLSRLTTVSIPRASAEQRTGRAGRVRPGIGVRLWSKIEHGTRAAHVAAEVTQVDLAGVRLELAAWGVREPDGVPLLDPLPKPAWAEAGALLELLGAIDSGSMITAKGRRLNQLPLHPRLGAVVLAGAERGMGSMACAIAALLDERDVLSGRPVELPVDLGVRLELLADPARQHPNASGRALQATRRRWRQLARRVDADDGGWDPDAVGVIVAAGFPDRVAQRRGSRRGRFLLRSGSGIQMADSDSLAGEDYLVAVDVNSRKKDSIVRIAAAVAVQDLLGTPDFETEVTERLVWDKERNDLVFRTNRFLGSIELGSTTRRPSPSADVVDALVAHVRQSRLRALPWTDQARSLQQRIRFLAEQRPQDDWPDLSDKALLKTLDEWLAPFLMSATGRADLEVVSVAVALDSVIGHHRRRDVDRLVPSHLDLAGRRRVKVDYSGETPVVASRAQDFYGMAKHPTLIDGEYPLTVELLSPANRPIQRTADIEGFWSGSWSEVRKDMAGRYPKHDWPINPAHKPRA